MKISHTTQGMSLAKRQQNLVITEKSLAFCLYHSGIRQEPEQVFLDLSKFFVWLFFPCQTLVQITDPAFYKNNCLLEKITVLQDDSDRSCHIHVSYDVWTKAQHMHLSPYAGFGCQKAPWLP